MSGIMLRTCRRSARLLHQEIFLPAGFAAAQAKNSLFTSSFLALETFNDARHKVSAQFGPLRDKFFQRMRENIEKTEETREQDSMVFTEDLKNTTYLVENKPEDLQLLTAMIKKYNAQNKDLRFGSFTFGPVVMRLLHVFRQPDLASSLINDPECDGFFSQMTTFTLAMDLLLESGRPDEVLQLYASLKAKSELDVKFPRDIMTLVMAAAYQLDTREAYEQVKGWLLEARQQAAPLSNRCVSFFVAMAVKHSEPELAYELMSPQYNLSALSRNVKLLCLAHLKRPDDGLLLIRGYLSADRGDRNFTGEFAKESLDALTQAVTESNQPELAAELEQVMRALREGNHISTRSLDQQLLEPIQLSRRQLEQRQGGNARENYLQRGDRMAGLRPAGDRNSGDRRPQFGGGYGRQRNWDNQDRSDDRGFGRRDDDRGFGRRGDDQGYGRRENRGFDRRPRDQEFDRRGLREQD